MSNYRNSNLLLACDGSDVGIIRAERVWQHRHDIDLGDYRPRRYRGLLAIGAGGVVLGLVCALYYALPVPTPSIALKDDMLAEPAVTNGPTKLQTIVDATPALIRDDDLSFPPVVVTPTRRPVSRDKLAVDTVNKTDVKAEMPAGVVRFDQCNPQCETQDPLIADPTPATLIPSNGRSDEQERALSPVLQGARYVLGHTAAAPFTALKAGRNVLEKIAGLE